MEEIFSLISSDGAYITKNDIKEFYNFFDKNLPSDKQIDKIIELYDTDKDGKISLEEFSVIELDKSDRLKETFYDFIANKNKDDLNYDEIKRIYSIYPIDGSISVNKHIEILKIIFDDNNDTKVSKKEFVSNLKL